jgi:hypothetical protein
LNALQWPLVFALGLSLLWGTAYAQNRINSSTLNGKLIFGFQGWFSCPGDGNSLGGWVHWFNRKNEATVDLLPDVSEFPPDEQCDTGLVDRNNRPVKVFSDQRYETVLRQFEWMREKGLDGVALQRFSQSVDDPKRLAWEDRILDNVRRAAEATGRVFFVQYDTGNKDGSEWPQVIEDDWRHLLVDKKITDSPAYLHEKGKPIFGITGPGLKKPRPTTPEQTFQAFDRIRAMSAQFGSSVTLFGTVPRGWRTLTLDAPTDPQWAKVFRSYDVISPWLVGTVSKQAEIDRQVQERIKPDLVETKRLGIGYMPVIFPGFSWANLHNDPGQFNKLPRRCGRFLWEQATAYIRAGATMLYGAMFDEVDEGTAFFKLRNHADELPTEPHYVALDAEGCDLPSDWYLRLAGKITLTLQGRSESFPALPASH